MKTKCRCGSIVDSEKGETLKSYFSTQTGMRVTVCDNCAGALGLNDTTKYSPVATNQLTEKQKLTPPKNAH